MNKKLFGLLAFLFSRFYFRRKEYYEPIYHFLKRIGWSGIVKEAISHLNFILATDKCVVMPRVVRFEVSNRCNLKCAMCPQPMKMKRTKKNMELDRFKTVIEKNPQIKEVELFNWGEPLMNPDIVKFVGYASDRNILIRSYSSSMLSNEK